jgi:Lon-like ATP-dependent protease
MGNAKGIGGAKSSKVPKFIVDNSKKVAPFIDATGHGSAQLFGSIAWDPLQTGGLGTPEHQRVTAGDVHRAHLGILYIDEIKNMQPNEAITLLTVLEDGQLPITMRSKWSSAGGTAAMAVSTEPVPCMCFLVGAGNFDSIGQVHPALMDRIYGYGKVVRMNNDMENTVENRRKYVQFIAQEVSRFRLMPFSRGACEEIVDEGRRRSNKKDALSTKFRPMISLVKTAATLAMNEGLDVVEKRHVKEAIEKHCKTIQKQILEHQMSERGKLLDITPEGVKLGQIYGVAVVKDRYSGEMTGNVLTVKGFLEKRDSRCDNKLQGYYKVTGIAKEGQEQFIADSVAKVRSVILQKYRVDIAQEFFTHIDFAQAYSVDGPSAGVTMTILLCSLLEGKPIRQDVAVTGEINVTVDDVVPVTAVGGLHEKIKSAEMWGFKKVIVPAKNYKHSIDPRDYSIEVIPGETLEDYLRESLIQPEDKQNKD